MRSMGLLFLVVAIAGVISAEVALEVKHYDITLNVESIEDEFLTIFGNTSILINVVNSASTITLNSRTKILSAKLISETEEFEMKKLTTDSSSSRVTLDFERKFSGLYTLVMQHNTYTIPDNQPETFGIVRKVYSSESKKKYNLAKEPNEPPTRSYMLLSRFENGKADRIFPCFLDNESNSNAAAFRVSIQHPPAYIVQTNVEKGGIMKILYNYTFNESSFANKRPMSPNDLVFFVSKLIYKNVGSITFWTAADMIDSSQTEFVLHFVNRAMNEIPVLSYFLQAETDLIALPLLPSELSLESDMDSELKNPELYSKLGMAFTNLYLFDKPTTFAERRHADKEDYVSCKAKYFDFPHARTQITVMRALVTQFIVGHLNLGNPKPLEELDRLLIQYLSSYYVSLMYPHFSEIMPTFDMNVDKMEDIRDIERRLPQSVFQTGIVYYIQDNYRKPANRTAFIKSMEESVKNTLGGVSLNDLLENDWSVSFPIINVTRNYETGDVHVSQVDQLQYLPVNGEMQKDIITGEYDRDLEKEMYQYQLVESDSKWTIPINIFNLEGSHPDSRTYSMEPSKDLIMNKMAESHQMVLVEPVVPGKSIVNYDIRNWNLIIDNFEKIIMNKDIVNINKIIKDARTLSIFGKLQLDETRKMHLRKIVEFLNDKKEPLQIIPCNGKPELPASNFRTPGFALQAVYNKESYLYDNDA